MILDAKRHSEFLEDCFATQGVSKQSFLFITNAFLNSKIIRIRRASTKRGR